MFRSPNSASSSESTSESDEEIEISRITTNKSNTEGTSATRTQHTNLITASLLEFHYSVRAAEILNVAHHGPPRYDRHSSEAKALAKKMFVNGSQLLASHGILAEDLHSDELEDSRQSYLTGINSLGLRALRDAGALPPGPRLALEAAGASTLAHPTQPEDLFLSDLSQTMLPTIPRLSDVSRYAADFTEVKQLGRGGFGTVYHVRNFVDNQHYAIKKIGLDPTRLRKRWEKGGQVEIQNVLREIRTLAALEHSNIVRYFGAWIEGPMMSSRSGLTELEGSRPPMFRRLLGDKSKDEGEGYHGTIRTDHSSCDAAFSSVHYLDRGSEIAIKPEASGSENNGIIFGTDSVEGGATTSTISFSNDDTEIFTDGEGRQGRPGPDSSPNQITLCLQMSLHQLNLATYLSTEPSAVPSTDPVHESVHNRHCFHLRPSLSIFLGILSGVQYLHSAGIVHRDLKPANIFLSEDMDLRPGFVDASCFTCAQPYSRYLNARIGDFGLVGNVAEELSAVASASDNGVGTGVYRPPSLQGLTTKDPKGKGLATTGSTTRRRIDEKIDVFALGVVLFELFWHFGTRTERSVVLDGLTRSATLPAGFIDMIDCTSAGGTGRRRSADEKGVERTSGADAADEEQDSESEGTTIANCIAGMVHRDPAQRWDCARVRTCVESALQTGASVSA